ncbi:hypothetical protein SIID45300_01883 [Candidatus Magnetaquicoccaceae bacterium FCR-1]|uniref:Uncharacterized protein n=1 Tax=Candidatus Magnetaquiglobus chichijimensis TaxID=3141448 RepID=A0ABQ0C9K5_9PROT
MRRRLCRLLSETEIIVKDWMPCRIGLYILGIWNGS